MVLKEFSVSRNESRFHQNLFEVGEREVSQCSSRMFKPHFLFISDEGRKVFGVHERPKYDFEACLKFSGKEVELFSGQINIKTLVDKSDSFVPLLCYITCQLIESIATSKTDLTYLFHLLKSLRISLHTMSILV